jgi:hypothetical protein
MIDKARLFAAGDLREDLHDNLGKAMDLWTCEFLHVSYSALVEKVHAGLSDEELLDWCFTQGKKPTEQEIKVWNGFMSRVGWRDSLASRLVERKAESGLADRDDVQSMFDYIDADEGRLPGSMH